jgi:carbamoyl-phosphate synthase large subunit
MAFAKSQIAAGNRVPMEGAVFISLNDRDKEKIGTLAHDLAECGFSIIATTGTAKFLEAKGLQVTPVFKVGEGRPNIVDAIINREVDWIINTPMTAASKFDEIAIRRTALEHGLPTMTTLAAARAGVMGIRAMRNETPGVLSVQEYHGHVPAAKV